VDVQRLEVDRNYDSFLRQLALLLPEHRNQYALMREGEILGFFDRPGDAYRAGLARFADGVFSIQEITDEPIDLGFWSHIASH
jgi:hypothetical protein